MAAQFSEDKSWYRGEVLSIGEKCKIKFVDCGNVDDVAVEHIAEITPVLMEFPLMGMRCTLAGLETLNSYFLGIEYSGFRAQFETNL